MIEILSTAEFFTGTRHNTIDTFTLPDGDEPWLDNDPIYWVLVMTSEGVAAFSDHSSHMVEKIC